MGVRYQLDSSRYPKIVCDEDGELFCGNVMFELSLDSLWRDTTDPGMPESRLKEHVGGPERDHIHGNEGI